MIYCPRFAGSAARRKLVDAKQTEASEYIMPRARDRWDRGQTRAAGLAS
jgi:hypothetical protein